MNNLLSGKKVLITGGTSVLGSAFVRKALENGARVFFTYFNSKEKAYELETAGAGGFRLDLTNTGDMERFCSGFKNENETLDALIHNAAVTADGYIEKLPEKDWDRVIAVNLKAPFYLTRQLLPLLMKAQPSKIFMVVSQAGLNGLAGAANYAASKGGLIAMTKTLAKELGRKKILVNAVNPGLMKSAMTANVPEAELRKSLDRSPLKTLSNPEEVAGFLVYLCSDLMKQVTGQVFHFESRPM